jgi:hypothetical protein
MEDRIIKGVGMILSSMILSLHRTRKVVELLRPPLFRP